MLQLNACYGGCCVFTLLDSMSSNVQTHVFCRESGVPAGTDTVSIGASSKRRDGVERGRGSHV